MTESSKPSTAISVLKSVVRFILFGAIVFGGFMVYRHLNETRRKPARKVAEHKPLLVKTEPARASNEPVRIQTIGTVMPAQVVTVFPEVPGRIVYQDSRLVPGGRFEEGAILVKIDARDYEMAVSQQQAQVQQAELLLAQEKGLKSVAEKEWKLIKDEVQPTKEGRKLALREVQLANALAMVTAAKSGLKLAQLRRGRTVIKAPFNAIVQDEFVDQGQVVSNASRIATLIGSDYFWVQVAVPMDRLGWISIPGVNGTKGSPAHITLNVGPRSQIERQGSVNKLLGDLDPQGKMARVLVQIDKPLESVTEQGQLLPLLLGARVAISIEGPLLEDIVAVPRIALHDQNKVWIKNTQSRLDVRTVEVVWATDRVAHVRGEIKPGEMVIISRISAPVAGMQLRSTEDAPSPEKAVTHEAEALSTKANDAGSKPKGKL